MSPIDSTTDQMKMRKVPFSSSQEYVLNGMNIWGFIYKAQRWFFNTSNELPLGCIADRNRLRIYMHISTLQKAWLRNTWY